MCLALIAVNSALQCALSNLPLHKHHHQIDISLISIYLMWPSHGHPSACLHISSSILSPYSITLSPPIASYPLPLSHVRPELLPFLPTNSLFIQCKLHHNSPTFIMLYALVQLPISSFYKPPSPPLMYHCTLGSHAVYDGIHRTLTYEYSILVASPTLCVFALLCKGKDMLFAYMRWATPPASNRCRHQVILIVF